MKKIFLVIFLAIAGTCFAFEQQQAKFPTAQMQSVNNYQPATNYKPNITPVGSTSVYDGSNYSPQRPIRRAESIGHGEDDNGGESNLSPVGDCPIELLIAFALICVVTIKIRSNKCKLSESTSTNG